MAGPFYYVYILESEKKPGAVYVGFTEDLRARLTAHNEGNRTATRPLRPWRILSYHAVRGKETALALEKLKQRDLGWRACLKCASAVSISGMRPEVKKLGPGFDLHGRGCLNAVLNST